MYSQFYEVSAFDVDMSILFTNVDKAREYLHDPDVTTPCLETFESGCEAQFFYAVCFAALGAYLVVIGLFRILLNLGPAWQRHQKGKTMAKLSRQGTARFIPAYLIYEISNFVNIAVVRHHVHFVFV